MTWDDYRRFDAHFEKLGFGRVSFFDGILEIMALSELHETIRATLEWLIQNYAIWQGMKIHTKGQATIGSRRKNAGKEPDGSFWFGRIPEPGEPADLVLEIVVSSPPGIDKLIFFARFAIPELWIWENERIQIHVLKKDGKGYKRAKRSQVFPDLDLAVLERCALLPELGQAVQEFRDAIEAAK